VNPLTNALTRTDSKLNAVLWIFALLGALTPIGFSVGKALHWF